MEDVEVKAYAYPDKFIQHGSVDELEKIYHLDEDAIVEDIQKHIELKLHKRNEDEKETEENLNESKGKDKNIKTEELKKNNIIRVKDWYDVENVLKEIDTED